jgi:hypothetical protein
MTILISILIVFATGFYFGYHLKRKQRDAQLQIDFATVREPIFVISRSPYDDTEIRRANSIRQKLIDSGNPWAESIPVIPFIFQDVNRGRGNNKRRVRFERWNDYLVDVGEEVRKEVEAFSMAVDKHIYYEHYMRRENSKEKNIEQIQN